MLRLRFILYESQGLEPDVQLGRSALGGRLNLTAVALACSLVALVCATFLLMRHSQLVRETTAQQTRLAGWQQLLQSVDTYLTDANAAQRDYLLTGDAHYLTPYRDATQQLPQVLEKLNGQPMADPGTAGQVREIRQQSTLKLEELADELRVYDQSGRDAAIAQTRVNGDQPYLQQVRADIGAITTNIRASRRLTNLKMTGGINQIQQLAIITVAALFLSVILASLHIRRLISAHLLEKRSLAASEQQHRAIVEEQTEFIALSRPDGSIKYANPAYLRFFQVTTPDLVGANLYNSIASADAQAMRARLSETMTTGQHVSLETRVTGPDGTQRWIWWRHRIQATDGEMVILSVGRDITLAKQAALALRATKEFLARTGRVAGVGGWQLDLQERQVHWSDELRQMCEVTGDFVPTIENVIDFYKADVRAAIRHAVDECINAGTPWDLELPLVTATGKDIYVRSVGEAEFNTDGKPACLIGAMQDITDRKAVELKEVLTRADLATQTATLNAVIETIPAMVAVWDTDLRYRLVNKAFERWRGKRREELIGRTLEQVAGDTEYPRSLEWVHRALGGETVSYEKEYPGARESRHVSITYIPLRLKDGQVGGFVEVAQDITLHREEHVRLTLLSERDPLTASLNRAGLEKYLRKKTEQGDGSSLAMLYVDIDHFKPINDTYGHATGDEVLREFAARLQHLVRPTDAVARLGGDEFGIVLSGIQQPEHAIAVADKVVELASQPFAIGALMLNISASIGIAFDADADGGWTGLVSRADALVYQAKANGRGRTAMAPADGLLPTQRLVRPAG
jgi:diguanylate cyclase (GGDEF)-like protein/PAS domain S-box-containing protein